MTTIQQNMALASHIENILRLAAINNRPMAIGDVFENADVKAVARDLPQVRDKVRNLASAGKVKSVPIAQSQSGDKRARVGYIWNLSESSDVPKPARRVDDAPSQMPKDVELVFNGIRVVIGRNPETKRLRIVIEE